MRKHYLQKVYREADRMVKIGEAGLKVKWSGQIDLEKNDELKDAVEKFTRDKNKKEIRQWTPENVEKRLEAIGSKYGKDITLDLLFAHISIYRHSSEIIHGTYFGAVFAAGYSSLTTPPKSKKELNIYHQKQLSLLMMMIGASISALLDVISKEIDISDIVKKSKEAMIKLGGVLEWDPLDDSQTSWSVKINNS